MKRLDDLLLDNADDDIGGKKQKTKEETEDEAEHRRWKKRVDMVRYAKTNYPMLIEFLQNNKAFFKTEHYTDRQREEMRRTCQNAYNDNIWKSGDSDLALFNECFGAYKEAKPRWDDVVATNRPYVWDNPNEMPFEKQVDWYADSSYYNWWNYIHSDKFLSAFRQSGIDRQKWLDTVDNVKMKNAQFFKGQKVYEESDETYYTELTKMIA